MGSLAATFNLLVAIHRHATRDVATDPIAAPASREPTRAIVSTRAGRCARPPPAILALREPAVAPKPPEPVAAVPPPEDPTKKALAGMARATAREIEAGQQADRRALALEAAREASAAESRRWKRRELLVRQQIAGLAARADELENAVSALDAERDVLATERDALKAALSKAGRRSGFAVLPYKGPNWDLAAADRAGMHVRRRQASTEGADIHVAGTFAARQSPIESARPGDRPRDAAHSGV